MDHVFKSFEFNLHSDFPCFQKRRLNLGVSIIKLMPDPKERDTFLSKKWVQTDKHTDRQTDIEHEFFEPSTQKAPSGQILFLRAKRFWKLFS